MGHTEMIFGDVRWFKVDQNRAKMRVFILLLMSVSWQQRILSQGMYVSKLARLVGWLVGWFS